MTNDPIEDSNNGVYWISKFIYTRANIYGNIDSEIDGSKSYRYHSSLFIRYRSSLLSFSSVNY